MHDVNALDLLTVEPGAFYVFDRGYIDFSRLYHLAQLCAYFVTRSKSNMQFNRVYSHEIDKKLGILCDQTIRLSGVSTSKDYPDTLRRIKYHDEESNRSFVFITNNFVVPSLTVAQLYKSRWQVELFFKWIKQHLRIKAFYGTSVNAVKTQIWIALCTYLLVSIVKKRLRLQASLYTILQILSVSLFEKVPVYQALTNPQTSSQLNRPDNQLNLFDL